MQKFCPFLMTLHMQMISHILALIVKGIMRLNAVHCQSALELMLITLIKELEHDARAALYLELEKEGSAAATAAD
ncbi:unnamed protein product [Camellia sinensis]